MPAVFAGQRLAIDACSVGGLKSTTATTERRQLVARAVRHSMACRAAASVSVPRVESRGGSAVFHPRHIRDSPARLRSLMKVELTDTGRIGPKDASGRSVGQGQKTQIRMLRLPASAVRNRQAGVAGCHYQV